MAVIFINETYQLDSETTISHNDSGFMTGIGIFDSMLALDSQLIRAHEHYERIIHDSQTVIGLKPNLSFDGFEKICATLFEKNKLQKGYVRVRTTITGGVVNAPLAPAHTPTILISLKQTHSPDKVEPITCAIIENFPRVAGCVLENCKRLDYSRSYAARRMAENLGAQEAILTNTNGNIACGATSNIFIEEDGILITPPLSEGVLAGVTRRQIMAERDVREEAITPEKLKKAQKAFLTNSFIGLREIKNIINL